MEMGLKADLIVIHEMARLIVRIKNKYWKLGRAVALTSIPPEIKSQFYSFGNDVDKFISLSKTIGCSEALIAK